MNISEMRPDYKMLFVALLSLVLSSLVFLGFWLYRKCHSDTIFYQRTPAALERIADALEANNRERFASENALNDLTPNPPATKEHLDRIDSIPGCAVTAYIRGGQAYPEYCR